MKTSYPITYRLLFECPDGSVLDLNIDSAKTRRHICNELLNWHPTGTVYSMDSNGYWFSDSMSETKNFILPKDLPNRIKMYLLVGA